MTAPAVVVAVPARDEERDLPVCLAHVLCSLTHARALGEVGRTVVAVAAHRCRDRTRAVAAEMLAGHEQVEGVVVEDTTSPSVGAARHRLVRSALRDRSGAAEDWWVLSTDADSVVPLTWVGSTLAAARATGSVAVAGLVEVREWEAEPHVRAAYDQLVSAGVGETGHSHVYGANLAVRLDAYDAVGGFRDLPHGEDQDLVDRVRAAGLGVATPLGPRVTTSGRVPGRADLGLAALLGRLADEIGQRTATSSGTLSEPA
ncbi:glycosyltransferase [Nocardioides marmoribigeumensis]|uniref:Glycosyltransferase n=1 Tax=Nocardioides marmoribigeumensis TaxID=433649 RepID=A0ABU2BS23_9ACTN|nr:glycosyltransferase [Nocardioides marmoribigeumensis]MDR7361434.1 hypothetical protein [Nocardioides marmoribigeumensis]